MYNYAPRAAARRSCVVLMQCRPGKGCALQMKHQHLSVFNERLPLDAPCNRKIPSLWLRSSITVSIENVSANQPAYPVPPREEWNAYLQLLKTTFSARAPSKVHHTTIRFKGPQGGQDERYYIQGVELRLERRTGCGLRHAVSAWRVFRTARRDVQRLPDIAAQLQEQTRPRGPALR